MSFKKLLLALVIAALCTTAALAEDEMPTVSIGWNLGGYYHSVLEGLNVQNARFGFGLDGMYNINEMFAVGVEADMILGAYRENILTDENMDLYLDFPIRLTGAVRLAGWVLQPFVGYYIGGYGENSAETESTQFTFDSLWEVGARIAIGDYRFLGLEVASVLSEQGFFRIGMFIRGSLFGF